MLERFRINPIATSGLLVLSFIIVSAATTTAWASSYYIEVRYAESGELLPAPELTSLELYADDVLLEIAEPYGGIYVFEDLEPDRTYRVDAYGTYMWLASATRTIGADEDAADVIVAPYLGTLKAKVLYADGITPLPNARMEVWSHGAIAWRAGTSAEDGWISWGGSDRTYLFPNRLPGEQWAVHTFYEDVGVAYPLDVQITEQGELTIQVTTTVPYDTAPQSPTPINPYDEQVLLTRTPAFEWTPYLHGGDQQTLAGYQLRVRCDEHASWHYEAPSDWGILPTGWMDDSTTSTTPTYRVTSFEGRDCLHLKTTGGTSDRIKVMSIDTYAAATYDWNVYIPPIDEPAASNVIAAWLYSPQSSGTDNTREIDFEIGYGTAAERAAYSIPTGKLMAYMTVQRDYSSGTNHSTEAIAIDPGSWYTFRILAAVNSTGQYQISWLIKKEGDAAFAPARDDYVSGYGPANTVFQVACSIENDSTFWIGDTLPLLDKHAYFDKVSVSDVIVYDTGFVSDTAASSHVYTPGLYQGFDSISESLRISDALAEDQHYHWHVRVRDTGGDWSDWSGDLPESHQDFYTTQPVTISGLVADSIGNGIADVAINGLPGPPMTGPDGVYTALVTPGFSGTATPTRFEYTFLPISRDYQNVSTDLSDQDFVATFVPDSDADGVPDALDLCPDTIPDINVDSNGCPPVVIGDFDIDGDVDADDYALFEPCIAGPATVQGEPSCQFADCNDDSYTDLYDFAIFQHCFSGTDVAADSNCAG